MKRKKLFFFAIFCLFVSSSFAQDTRITGKVTSSVDGTPLAGVSVIISGTSRGTQTNSDGVFEVLIAESSVSLSFRYLGYVSQTVQVGNRTYINVELDSDDSQLSEVVVTGYGTVRKSDFVGNVASISGDKVTNIPIQSFDQALGGKAAGAQVSISNGVVGNPPVFRIRGTNSISLSSYPLIIIDGVPTLTTTTGGNGTYSGSSSPVNPLTAINPNDIENIEILKDASATAIYGSRAANGVVIVTTKRGKSGKAQLAYDAWVGVNQVQRLPDLLDAFQYVDIKNEALRNAGIFNADSRAFNLDYDASGNPINTNWYDYVYRNGVSHNNSLSVRGGNEDTRYFGSVNYTDQEGIVIGNDYSKLGGNFNIDHSFAKIFKVGTKINMTDEQTKSFTSSGSLPGQAFSITGLGRIAMVSQPNVSPFNNDGSYNVSGNALGPGANTAGTPGYYNIAVIQDFNRSNTAVKRFQGNGFLQADPLSWLSLKTLYGIDYFSVNDDVFYTPINGDGFASEGYAYRQDVGRKTWVWTNTFDIHHTFNDEHYLHLLGGNEQTRTTTDGFWADRSGLSDAAFEHIGAGFVTPGAGGQYSENYLVSFFGSLNYDFRKKYFLNGSFRRDEYSAFGQDQKGGNFYSVGAAYDLAKEDFWSNSSFDNLFSSFRLRGSYGTVGNFNGLSWLAPQTLYEYNLYGTTPSLNPSSSGNPAIGWETSKKLDVGLNLGILNDRFTIEAAYYKNDIDGLIYQVPQAPSAGLISNPNVNIGSMVNKGFELTLNAQAIGKGDFSWTPSFNLTYNHNEVLSLSESVTQFTSQTSGLEISNITVAGGPIGQLFVVRTGGVDPETGRRIFINRNGDQVFYEHAASGWRYADGSEAPAIGSNDQVPYENTVPRYYGGFINNFRYKNFDLMLNFTFQFDYSIYWGTGAGLMDQRAWNNSTTMLNRWTEPGQITDVPRVIFGDNQSNGSATASDIHVYSGDFLKLRDINLGYTLPTSPLQKVGISRLRFYVNANNAIIFTKYPGTDPEVSSNGNSNVAPGVDRNSVANGRTFTAGVNLLF